jgi:hypothetical protein
MVLIIPALIAGAGSIIGGIIAGRGQQQAADQELKWAQHVQRMTWRREDTAIQRRMRDLKKSGLSPLLAVGQPAQASQPLAGQQAASAAGRRKSAMGNALQSAFMNQQFAQSTVDIARQWQAYRMEKMQADAMGTSMKNELTGKYEKLGILAAKARMKTDQLNYEIRDAEKEIRIHDVNRSQIDYAFKKYEYQWRKHGLNVKEMELLARWYALESQRMALDIDEMDWNYFKKVRIPPVLHGYVAGAATKAATSMFPIPGFPGK